MENNEMDNDEKVKQLLTEFVQNLNDLPTDILKQILSNLEEVEQYNKSHPEEFNDNNNNK